MSSIRVLSRNISWNYVEAGVSAVVYFALTPFVVQRLGEIGFGIWILLKAIMYCLRFLDLGFCSALVKYTAEYAERRAWSKVNALVATTISVLVVAGIIALLGSGIVAWFLVPTVFHVPQDRIAELQVATVLIGINLLIGFPGSALHAVFAGRHRFDVLSGIAITVLLITTAGTVLVLSQGYGIIALVCVDLVGTISSIGLFLVFLRRVVPEVRLRLGRLNGHAIRRIRGYSTWTSLNEILVEGSIEVEKLLLPTLLAVSVLTPYTLITKISAVIFLAVEPITHTFFPLSSAYDASRDVTRLRMLLLRGTKVVMAISLPLAVAVASYGDRFLVAWIGRDYVTAPPGVLPLVVASFSITAFALTPITILMALSKVKEVFWMNVGEIGAAVILVILMAPRWGLVGVAGSLLLANFVSTFFWIVPYICRVLGQQMTGFLWQSIFRPLLATLPMVLAVLWMDTIIEGASVPWLAVKAVLAGSIYLVALYTFSLTRQERILWHSTAKQMLGRASE